METGGLPALDIVLFVLILPILLLLAAYGLIKLWEKTTQAAVGQLAEQIHDLNGRIQEIAVFLRSYEKVAKEPYATYLDELHKEASEADEQIHQFVADCRAFEEGTRQAGPNRLQDIINAPFKWYGRWRRSAALLKDGQTIAEHLTRAEEHQQHIYEVPLDLAKQCQQADIEADELFKITQALQLKGLCGPALETLVSRTNPQISQALQEIPENFFETNPAILLAEGNQSAAIRVFDLLSRIQPALAHSLPQVREWNTTYDKANAEYNELKVSGANLRQAMEKPPQGLMIDSLNQRLDQIAQMAADLYTRLSKPKVEDLKPLAREISQLHRVIQDTEQQFSRASQQVNELNQVLNELHNGLEKLGQQISDLEHIDVFPLALDASSSLMGDLRKRLQALGPAQQPRTPEQIAQHLKELEGIRTGHQTHSEAFPKIAGQHRTLTELLNSPEIKEGAAWLRKARETINQAAIYDPRNWTKQDSIQTLPVELEELNQIHETLVPVDQASPILESELEQRLKDTQYLVALHKRLRPRMESAQARLAKIQTLEKDSKEKLTASYTTLERIAILAENNDLLGELASNEIDRLSEEIRQLGNELNARSQGELEKKSQRINAQAAKVNQALNTWLAQVNAAIAELGSQMNGLLIHLDGIAQFEDHTITDVRDLLSRDEYVSAIYGSRGSTRSSSPNPKPDGMGALRGMAAKVAERGAALQRQSQLNDLDATAEIKRKNDLWLTLSTMYQALNEKTESLLAAYEETITARNAAQEELAEFAKRVPDRRNWPPSNQTPLGEAQVMRPIDAKREALKKQPKRVEAVILELGHLTQQYQHVKDHAHQLLNWVAQDEERIQELEEQINEVKQRWQAHGQSDPGNAVFREGVQKLISQADSNMASIKQQYMRGSMSYEQVIRSLQQLYNELFSSRVAVDDKNEIGLNESYRQKTAH
jgi:hypothetical protein